MNRATPSAPSAEGRLDIRLFGRPAASVDGVPVKFAKRSTTLAMLALIVLQRGAAVSRESLAFTLFPEAEEAAALAELRRYLYLANKALPERAGQPQLIVDSETIRWNDDAEAFVDVLAFERLASDPATHAQAIELYTGDLLEDVYDDWIVTERERLRTRYLAIVAESLDRHRARREFAEAVACAKRILATDPWREDTLRALVAVRYESGDTAGALAEYEQFAKRLRDDLGVAPMPETVAVRQSILRNDAVPGSLEVRSLASSEAARRTAALLPFVGRRRELATLHAVWSRAARGAGALVLLSGEAGAGKTRLTAELAQRVQAEGGRVYVGTTAAPESTPYQAIVEALRSGLPLLLARPPEPARRAVLAGLIPEIADPAAPTLARPQEAAERETARVYDALAHAVRALASPRPLLLVLEDLHWAGPATIEALGALARDIARAPVLVVATAREEETPPDHALRALVRGLRVLANVEEVALDRLSEDDVSDLVTRVAGLKDRGDDLARDLFTHSEGNALFLNEAISGVLERDEPPDRALETSISSILAARIEQLGEFARTVAEIAAVAGPGCSVELVREVSNLPGASVARGFDELLDRRILREAGARASYDYVFTHHLIGEAMYGTIEAAFRAQRHARIASVLAAHDRARPESSARLIARHFELGGDSARSGDWYLLAAKQAVAVHAYVDAIEVATRGLELQPDVALRRALLDVREKAGGRRGDRASQREDIDELERLAGSDRALRFDVLARRVLLARSLGESAEEGRYIAEMETLSQELGEAERAQALAERATYAGLRSRQPEGLEPARAALEIYERLGDVRGQLDCLYLLVDFTTNTGDIEGSRAYLALMHERAQNLSDQISEARALAVAATAALLRQEYRESYELSSQALALQIATNDREAEAATRSRLAAAATWLGDFRTALREFDLALASYESIGNKRGQAIVYTNRAMLLLRLGLFAESLQSIERSNELFATVNEQRTIVANRVNASFAMLQLGDAASAKELARSALDDAKAIGMPVFEAGALSNLGNAERALGEIEAATLHAEAAIEIRRRVQDPRDIVDDLADLILTYISAGRPADALAVALELETIGQGGSFWQHYVYWAMAQGFEAGGRPDRARDAAEKARAELAAFAAGIEDDATRATFMSVPINARIARST